MPGQIFVTVLAIRVYEVQNAIDVKPDASAANDNAVKETSLFMAAPTAAAAASAWGIKKVTTSGQTTSTTYQTVTY